LCSFLTLEDERKNNNVQTASFPVSNNWLFTFRLFRSILSRIYSYTALLIHNLTKSYLHKHSPLNPMKTHKFSVHFTIYIYNITVIL
jgi:hypothetical protein